MFGYITINPDELKIKDYKTYRACYCGICQELKEHHGQFSRMTLTYDMTFLAILLSGLYEDAPVKEAFRCLPHPIAKHPTIRNAYTAYAADMNVLLAYYDLLDDWEDERKISGLILAKGTQKSFKAMKDAYPRQAEALLTYMKRLKDVEKRRSTSIDEAAGYTGELFGEVFAMKDDAFRDILYRLGYQIGKFIYLSDAAEDLEEDIKTGSYNPFAAIHGEADVQQRIHQILLMIAADAAKELEYLPIAEHVDILRNILYCGIWTKKTKKRTGEYCDRPV